MIIAPIILGTIGFLYYHFTHVNWQVLEATYIHASKVVWLQDQSLGFLFGIGGVFLFEFGSRLF